MYCCAVLKVFLILCGITFRYCAELYCILVLHSICTIIETVVVILLLCLFHACFLYFVNRMITRTLLPKDQYTWMHVRKSRGYVNNCVSLCLYACMAFIAPKEYTKEAYTEVPARNRISIYGIYQKSFSFSSFSPAKHWWVISQNIGGIEVPVRNML